MKRSLPIIVSCIFFVTTTSSDAADRDWAERYFFRIVYVTPDGQGDGGTWRKATSLQRLVDEAADEAAILNSNALVRASSKTGASTSRSPASTPTTIATSWGPKSVRAPPQTSSIFGRAVGNWVALAPRLAQT